MDLAEGEAVGDFGPAAFIPGGEAEAALVEADLDLAGRGAVG